MIIHIIRDYGKLAQREYKVRQDWVVNKIHSKLRKIFKFHHPTIWYMLKQSLSHRIKHIELFWILKYKQIINSPPDDQT